jgi:hypothetical protein
LADFSAAERYLDDGGQPRTDIFHPENLLHDEDDEDGL